MSRAVLATAGGFDPRRPSFVSWLGVTYYLALDAVRQTLGTIASWAPDTHVVFDYFLPRDTWPPDMHVQAVDYAALGEPWITWWTDDEVDRLLTDCGLETVELLTTTDIIKRYAPNAPIELRRDAPQHIAHGVVRDSTGFARSDCP